jgi:2-oxoglutarate ferredoxin oxidoreductase subunit beta
MNIEDIKKPENIVYKKTPILTDNVMHYCPGCSHGTVHKLLAEVIEEMGIQGETVGVSPVGCSVFAYNYLDIDWQQAAHGRAPALATATKRLMPEKYVFTYQGDGDLASIGTAEIIHACSRGENIVVIFINNGIYGMTGGQYSPTTPHGEKGTTAPYGNIDYNFDIPKLAEAAGATFTGRCTAYHVQGAVKLIEDAINHHGFSLIEGMSVCPTYYGRKNKKGDSIAMIINCKNFNREIAFKTLFRFVENGFKRRARFFMGKIG